MNAPRIKRGVRPIGWVNLTKKLMKSHVAEGYGKERLVAAIEGEETWSDWMHPKVQRSLKKAAYARMFSGTRLKRFMLRRIERIISEDRAAGLKYFAKKAGVSEISSEQILKSDLEKVIKNRDRLSRII